MAEAGSADAGHNIFTARRRRGCAGHSDNMHLGLVVWVETGNPFTKEGYLSVAIIQVGEYPLQKRVPQDSLGALNRVSYDEVHICNPAHRVHRQSDFPHNCQVLGSNALQNRSGGWLYLRSGFNRNRVEVVESVTMPERPWRQQ